MPVKHPLLPGYAERSSPLATAAGWLILGGLLALFVALLPPGLPKGHASTAILTLGIIGTWRWSWGGLHLVRALLYKHWRFPKIRRAAERASPPPALGIVVTSYRIDQAMNAAVYGRLFDEIASFGAPAYVVACITDPADVGVLEDQFRRRALPEGTGLHLISQRGRGKRDTMAEALRGIAGRGLPPGAQIVLMDGDSLLGEGALALSCRVLAADPKLGAVTTDNIPLVRGDALAREWYRLRMAHRDTLMASISLSRRLLVLTGRFSVFRVEIAASCDFIRAIEFDVVHHARLGRIPMLTGDDKSSWFEVLRRGFDMLYVPDAVVYSIEELPPGGFGRATTALMRRWYGNMVRNNGRALRLGVRRCGLFTWTCLLDQRISMWTALVGPATALLLCTRDSSVLPLYLIWVLVSRTVLCGVYWVATGRFHPLFVPALYYNQVVGSAVKILAFHHPDRQSWTRQKAGAPVRRSGPGAWLSTPYMVLTTTAFLILATVLTGALDSPRTRREAGRQPGLASLLTDLPRGTALAPASR